MTVKDFMIRNVMFIWYGMSYKGMKSILKENRSLGSFPLVENPQSMILLGSIHRQHLNKVRSSLCFPLSQCGSLKFFFVFFKAIEKHIGRERRIQAAAKWHREAAARAREELERRKFAEIQSRRPSRFEVFPVPSIITSHVDPTSSQDSVKSNQLPIHGVR